MKKIVFALIVLTAFVVLGGSADCSTQCFGNCCTETCCVSGYDYNGYWRQTCTTCQTCCTNFGGMQNCSTNCY